MKGWECTINCCTGEHFERARCHCCGETTLTIGCNDYFMCEFCYHTCPADVGPRTCVRERVGVSDKEFEKYRRKILKAIT